MASRKKSAVRPRQNKKGSHAFAARLEQVGGGFCRVVVPGAVSGTFGARGHIPVVLRVNRGEPVRTSLLPDGKGGHFVWVNAKARKAAGVVPGDRLAVEVCLDLEPRGAALPPDLADLLDDEGVLEAWWALPPGQREQLLRWVDQAVHEATRAKRLARVVERAHARRERLADEEM